MTMNAMTNRPMGVVVAVVNVAEIIIVLPGENVTIANCELSNQSWSNYQQDKEIFSTK